MKQAAVILVVTSVVLMIFLGFQPSTAENPGAEVIGEYHQLGSPEDLTTNHVDWVDDVMEIAAPPLTSKLKVEIVFLEQELGAWASLEAFSVGEGVVEFDSQQASFVNLSLGAESVFTLGSSSQIEFLERPMWISIQQVEHGGQINLTMEDGDSSGQNIYVSKDWLWDRGIHRPNATHEDGTVLLVNETENGEGFVIEVHHFSNVVIDPVDLDVKGRQGGVVFSHTEESRWYQDEKRLEVDVDEKLIDYDVLIEKDWVSVNIGDPWVDGHSWGDEEVDEVDYYVAYLNPEETPTTVNLVKLPWIVQGFSLNFTDFTHKIDNEIPVKLPAGGRDELELLLTKNSIPFEFSGQGGPYLVYNLTEDTDPDIDVQLYLSSTGFLGRISLLDMGLEYYYTPGSPEGETEYNIFISLPGCWRIYAEYSECPPQDPPTNNYPYEPPEPSTIRDILPVVFAEESYCNQFADCGLAHLYAHDSIFVAHSMWLEYAGADLEHPHTSHNLGEDLHAGGDCSGHWWNFRNYLHDNDLMKAPEDNEGYLSLTSNQHGSAIGCINRNSNSGTLASDPVAVVVALDLAQYNYEGLSNNEHLGSVIAQEFGHAWGETSHDCKYEQGEVSIMCDNTDYHNKAFWLHYGDPSWNCNKSTERIISGIREYDNQSPIC